MTTKHTPATPLPWTVANTSALIGANGLPAERHADQVYKAHAANAYPRQVQAGKELAQMARECIEKRDVSNVLLMDAVLRMEALLRELGEAP